MAIAVLISEAGAFGNTSYGSILSIVKSNLLLKARLTEAYLFGEGGGGIEEAYHLYCGDLVVDKLLAY